VRYALLYALIGLLPDVDVMLRIHRWVTHSLMVVALMAVPIVAISKYLRRDLLKYLVLGLTAYTLHIVLDVFTAPTPLAWPMTGYAYMVILDVNGLLSADMLKIITNLTITIEPTDFTPRTAIEGPIITATGVVLVLTTATISITERVVGRYKRVRS